MDKTARQDPLFDILQTISPALYGILRNAIGSKRIQIGEYEGRMPGGLLGVFDISKLIPEFARKEELEEIMKPVSEQAEKFRQSLAFNINKNVFKMDNRAAWEHAKNKYTAGSAAAWLLMQAGGANEIFKNLEQAAVSAGVTPGSVVGLKAQARNRKISNMLVNAYSHIIDPDNLGKMGNMDALEASTMIGPIIRSGMLNNILENPQAWNNQYQLRPEYAQQIRKEINVLGQGLSEAGDAGIVSGDPRQAWGQLTQIMGSDPITSMGPGAFRDTMRELDYMRRSAGLSKQEMAQLIPSAVMDYRKAGGNGIQALGAVKGFLSLRAAGSGAYSANVDPSKYNKSVMGVVNNIVQNTGVLAGAVYAGLVGKLGKERADEVMHLVMKDPNNLRDASGFVAKVGDISGVRMSLDNLKYLRHSPDALQYQAKGEYITPVLKLYREGIAEDIYKAMQEPGFSYIAKHLPGMGGALDANIRAVTRMYNVKGNAGVNTGDIAYGKARERLNQVFREWGMDYDQGQRFLQSIPGENVTADLDPRSPSSKAQSSKYLDRQFDELYTRRNLPYKVKNPEFYGGIRGATQLANKREWEEGDVWEAAFGSEPEATL